MGYFVLTRLVLKCSFLLILTNMSVKIGFWILYFNPNSTFVKGGVGILKAFMTWVMFFLLLRFDLVKWILWCRSLGRICLCKKLTGFEKSSLYPFSLFLSHENSFSKRLNVNLEAPKFCWKISETNKCNSKRRPLGINSHCSWRVMYECVETWTKACFFSNVQGLITTKCVMSVVKSFFFHSCLPFSSFLFLYFMSIDKWQAMRRR